MAGNPFLLDPQIGDAATSGDPFGLFKRRQGLSLWATHAAPFTSGHLPADWQSAGADSFQTGLTNAFTPGAEGRAGYGQVGPSTAAPSGFTGWTSGGGPVAGPLANQNAGYDLNDPRAVWDHADPNDRSYRYFDDLARKFYDANPTQAFRQFTDDQFGNGLTPLQQYARGQYASAYAAYLRESEAADAAGKSYTITDYLDKNLVNNIRQSFYMQTPTNKGYALQWNPNGRYTG